LKVFKEANVWKLFKVRTASCTLFAGNLQDAADRLPMTTATRDSLLAELSSELRSHAEHCANCSLALDDLLAVCHSLQPLRTHPAPGDSNDPWFATRVMQVIASKERAAELGNPTWRAVPRVASRMAGAAAVFLLLAGTWVARNRAVISNDSSANMSGAESLFDSAQPVVTHDDPLASVLESDR
jgi:hypothetical protein